VGPAVVVFGEPPEDDRVVTASSDCRGGGTIVHSTCSATPRGIFWLIGNAERKQPSNFLDGAQTGPGMGQASSFIVLRELRLGGPRACVR